MVTPQISAASSSGLTDKEPLLLAWQGKDHDSIHSFSEHHLTEDFFIAELQNTDLTHRCDADHGISTNGSGRKI